MRKAAFAVMTAAVVPLLVLPACKKDDETAPAQQPVANPQQPGYPAQPGAYPAQPAPTAATPAPAATTPAPAATAGAMSVPGPVATPCQNDSPCLTHRCNLQYGKCAFPCTPGNPNDCQPGNNCVAGACVPGTFGGAAPAPTQ